MSNDEITNELIQSDLMLKQSSNHIAGNIWIDDEPNITVNRCIINMCIYGICRYNNLSVPHSNINNNNLSIPIYSAEFINYVIDNLEMFLEHGKIPSFMQEYYIDVLNRGNINYLNNYLLKHGFESEEGRVKGIGAYTKATAVGRALSEKDNGAFVSVLILPAMLALIYISVVVIYFIFFYNGG